MHMRPWISWRFAGQCRSFAMRGQRYGCSGDRNQKTAPSVNGVEHGVLHRDWPIHSRKREHSESRKRSPFADINTPTPGQEYRPEALNHPSNKHRPVPKANPKVKTEKIDVNPTNPLPGNTQKPISSRDPRLTPPSPPGQNPQPRTNPIPAHPREGDEQSRCRLREVTQHLEFDAGGACRPYCVLYHL